jgi:RNA polymerase sigma factor (sigma-70 family)
MPDPPHNENDIFATTRWTIVLHAKNADDTTQAHSALAELCQTYWYPLYAYIRHRGHKPHDAEDLTQGFFEKFLRLHSLNSVSPDKGKFRAFLLASLKHFLADQRDRANAHKRDTRRTFSLDAQVAESKYALEPAHTLTPERLYERRWALTLLDTVLQRLAHEYQSSGRGQLFKELRFSIAGEKNAVPYHDLAARLDMSEEALRVAVFRLRKKFRQTLREEIAHTVTSSEEIEEELQSLRQILSQS